MKVSVISSVCIPLIEDDFLLLLGSAVTDVDIDVKKHINEIGFGFCQITVQ